MKVWIDDEGMESPSLGCRPGKHGCWWGLAVGPGVLNSRADDLSTSPSSCEEACWLELSISQFPEGYPLGACECYK